MDDRPAWARRLTTEREARGWNKPQFTEALRAHAPSELPTWQGVDAAQSSCVGERRFVPRRLTDNAVGLIHTTGPNLEKLAAKYSPLIPSLRELILRPDTPLAGEAKRRIVAQLDSAAGRLALVQALEA
jgi:hypothetical protein